MGKKIEDYFNDEGVEDIPDNLDQQEFLDDHFLTLAIKRIFLTINHTKNLVRYVKLVRCIHRNAGLKMKQEWHRTESDEVIGISSIQETSM